MNNVKNQFNSLLLTLMFFTSCNGQSSYNINDKKSFTTEHPKTLKLQAKNKMATIGFGMQDKSGNIWFASNGDGIYLFNGKNFRNYREEDGLDNNIVYSILEDNNGNIWVGTKTGLNRYNPNEDSKHKKIFTPIPIQLSITNIFSPTNLSNVNPRTENGVWCMMQDRDGTIWMGTDDGVYCYSGTNFTRFLDNKKVINNDSLQLKSIFSILQDTKGHIWFTACVYEGVSRFDGKNLSNIIPHENIRRTDRIIEDQKGILWLAAVFKGVCRYDGVRFANNVFGEEINKGPNNIVQDNDGNLWFGTEKGLGFYNGKTFSVLTEQDGLPIKNLSPVLKDKLGNLWFREANMRLYYYDRKTFFNYSE